MNYGDTIPKATVVWEVSEELVDDPVKFVSEWEKDTLKKIFKKYDKGIVILSKSEKTIFLLLQIKVLMFWLRVYH